MNDEGDEADAAPRATVGVRHVEHEKIRALLEEISAGFMEKFLNPGSSVNLKDSCDKVRSAQRWVADGVYEMHQKFGDITCELREELVCVEILADRGVIFGWMSDWFFKPVTIAASVAAGFLSEAVWDKYGAVYILIPLSVVIVLIGLTSWWKKFNSKFVESRWGDLVKIYKNCLENICFSNERNRAV